MKKLTSLQSGALVDIFNRVHNNIRPEFRTQRRIILNLFKKGLLTSRRQLTPCAYAYLEEHEGLTTDHGTNVTYMDFVRRVEIDRNSWLRRYAA